MAYRQTLNYVAVPAVTPVAANLTVTVGTAGTTVADVGASFVQATLNSNFRVVADRLNTTATQLNAVITALQTMGVLA